MRTCSGIIVTLALALFVATAGAGQQAAAEHQKEKPMQAIDYKTIPFKTITGEETNLDAYKGKVVLLVNTASECGYTPQYAGLEKLYLDKKDKGFVILGFPANNFGGQEPGSNKEILKFCQSKFNVTFPMMAKVSVKGNDKHELFKYLTEDSAMPGEIKWNFNKFLLDKNGNLVARYESAVTPNDTKLVGAIDKLLSAQ